MILGGEHLFYMAYMYVPILHLTRNTGWAKGDKETIYSIVRSFSFTNKTHAIPRTTCSWINLLQQLGDVLLSLRERVFQLIPLFLNVLHLATQQLQASLDSSAPSAYPLPLVILTKTGNGLMKRREIEKEHKETKQKSTP